MRGPAALPGRTLIVANPAARSGEGAREALRLRRALALYHGDPSAFDLVLTRGPGDAARIAREASGYRTVVALGGDGVIHEVAAGLMAHPRGRRPVLGVVPAGSGNDYALTLGIDPSAGGGLGTLLESSPVPMDVGEATVLDGSGTRTEYFVETLSVGIDAAIGLDTCELRKSAHLTGGALYTASALRVLGGAYRAYPMRASFDGGEPVDMTPHLVAVQIGPTYGSGFRVCPGADPSDGLFDVCYADGPVPRAVALPVLLRARRGRHVSSRIVHILRAREVVLDLGGGDYPIQADGERVRARRLAARIVPRALDVLVPRGRLRDC